MGQDIGRQALNAVGMGLGALSTIQALRSGQYQNQAIARANALSDPSVRAGLVNSPFTAGTLFVGGGPKTLAAPATTIPEQPAPLPSNIPGPPAPATPFQVNIPQQTGWTPNLPPMSPEETLKQTQAQAGVDLSQTDPIVSRAASEAGTPEDIGQIIQRAGPQGISNITAKAGSLGYFQQPYYSLGQQGDMNVLYGPNGEIVRTAGAVPGAAAEIAIAARKQADLELGQRQAAARAARRGVASLQDSGFQPTTVPTSRGPMTVPADVTAAAGPPPAPTVTPAGQAQMKQLPAGQVYVIQPDGTLAPARSPQAPTPAQMSPTGAATAASPFTPVDQLDLSQPAGSFVSQGPAPKVGYASPAPSAGPAPSPVPQPQQGSGGAAWGAANLPPAPPGAGATPPEPGSNLPATKRSYTDINTGEAVTASAPPATSDRDWYARMLFPGVHTAAELDANGVRKVDMFIKGDALLQKKMAKSIEGLPGTEVDQLITVLDTVDVLADDMTDPALQDYGGQLPWEKAKRFAAGWNLAGDPVYAKMKLNDQRLLSGIFGIIGKQTSEREIAVMEGIMPNRETQTRPEHAIAQYNMARQLRTNLAARIEAQGGRMGPGMVERTQNAFRKIDAAIAQSPITQQPVP